MSQSMSSMFAPSDVIIRGAAVSTMVASSRMAKLPMHSTSSANHGLPARPVFSSRDMKAPSVV
jgi:hypothetical protein